MQDLNRFERKDEVAQYISRSREAICEKFETVPEGFEKRITIVGKLVGWDDGGLP